MDTCWNPLCVRYYIPGAMVTVVNKTNEGQDTETFSVGKLIEKSYSSFAYIQKDASRTIPENIFSIYSLLIVVHYNYKIRVLIMKYFDLG